MKILSATTLYCLARRIAKGKQKGNGRPVCKGLRTAALCLVSVRILCLRHALLKGACPCGCRCSSPPQFNSAVSLRTEEMCWRALFEFAVTTCHQHTLYAHVAALSQRLELPHGRAIVAFGNTDEVLPWPWGPARAELLYCWLIVSPISAGRWHAVGGT
jgi:hypothetical protein